MFDLPRHAKRDERSTPDLIRGLVISLFLVAGCDQTSDELIDQHEMGPLQKFEGVWSLAFEQSDFAYCTHGAKDCLGLTSMDQGCWLMTTGADSGELEKLLGNSLEEVETLYVRFKGRETLRRGEYGHLGSHSCMIIGEELLSAERIEPSPR